MHRLTQFRPGCTVTWMDGLREMRGQIQRISAGVAVIITQGDLLPRGRQENGQHSRTWAPRRWNVPLPKLTHAGDLWEAHEAAERFRWKGERNHMRGAGSTPSSS